MNIRELLKNENKTLKDFYDPNRDIYIFEKRKLTSLEGLPEDFNTELWLYDNNLRNLKGLPKGFNNFIDLERNKLEDLKSLPEDFNSELLLYENKLKNLEGLPKNYNNIIFLDDEFIKTLDGLNDVLNPKNIYGLDEDFIISEYIRLGKSHLLI